MELELKGKSVVITGASKGIGLACAKAFAMEGCDVHLVSRNSERLRAARDEILALAEVAVSTHSADLSNSDDVKATIAKFSGVDVLVNNAGAIPGGSIEDVDGVRWREGWDLKVFGYIDATREMLRYMYERRSGVVVNIIGTGGVTHSYEYVSGSTGNAALIAFTNAIGSRSVDFGVRVVGVNPGAVATERYRRVVETVGDKPDAGSTRSWQRHLTDDLPFSRPGRPEEIADMVTFLSSKRASYVSGTVINVDAGMIFR